MFRLPVSAIERRDNSKTRQFEMTWSAIVQLYSINIESVIME